MRSEIILREQELLRTEGIIPIVETKNLSELKRESLLQSMTEYFKIDKELIKTINTVLRES